MKRLISISTWALAVLVGVCLSACSFHDIVDKSQEEQLNGVFFEFNIKLPVDASTRAATPTGGEEGDGTEAAKNNESKIHNLMVFIFRASEGFDADESTMFLYKGYFESTSPNCEWTETSEGVNILFQTSNYEPKEDDRVIIVANTGDFRSSISTLGALRDCTNYLSWKEGSTIKDNDYFVMTSAHNYDDDGHVHLSSHTGLYDDPYIATINIQRTAARIDFMYNSTDNLKGSEPYNELAYNVKENPNNSLSRTISVVHLQNIIPLNLMQESSYLIKRVTSSDDITSAVKYGSTETTNASGMPTNYVIEPHTLLKESAVTGSTLDKWYGATRAKTIFDNPTANLTTATGINHYLETSTAQSELSYFTHYMTLAYTNENTQSQAYNDPSFMTGLLLKAIYEPCTVYTDKDKTIYDHQEEYETGKTFWRYSPTKAEMTEKDCLYFTNEAAAVAYKAEHPEDLAEITEYPGGVCYYTIWLRHANIDLDPHDTFPMEYGIVRNNIYRIGINQYTGPGPVLPVYEDLDNMNLRIFVRKWNLREQPVIRL